jgi:hypothetical protein
MFLLSLTVVSAQDYFDHSRHINFYEYITEIETLGKQDMLDLIDELSEQNEKVHTALHEGTTVDKKHWEEVYDKVLIANYICYVLHKDPECNPKAKFWHEDLDTRGKEYNKKMKQEV